MDKTQLKIYIAGPAHQAMPAVANLRQFCEDELSGACEIEIIDVLEHPELALRDGIIATPTLVKAFPPPVRRILGDLSDREALCIALNLNRQPRE